MSDDALYEFTSHIAGKNAKVRIYSDRIEWEQPRGLSGGKLTAGALTLGASLFVTGTKNRKAGTEMIPVKAISSVATKRDGMLNTIVSVITSGALIDFRVSHADAKRVREILNGLVLAGPPAAASASVPAAAPDPAAEIAKYAELHRQGVLTDEEFTAKKAQLLG